MIGRSRYVFAPKLGSSILHLAKQSLISVSAMLWHLLKWRLSVKPLCRTRRIQVTIVTRPKVKKKKEGK